jgi:hypothetical protein
MSAPNRSVPDSFERPLRVYLFGTYDRIAHPRIAILEAALRAAGAEVVEAHTRAWRGAPRRSCGPLRAAGQSAAAGRLAAPCRRLGAAGPAPPPGWPPGHRAGRLSRAPGRAAGPAAGGQAPGGAGHVPVGVRHRGARPRLSGAGQPTHPPVPPRGPQRGTGQPGGPAGHRGTGRVLHPGAGHPGDQAGGGPGRGRAGAVPPFHCTARAPWRRPSGCSRVRRSS